MDLFAHVKLRHVREGANDVFFSSKGHDAPGLYAIMMATKALPADLIHRLRRLDGLPGHPDVGTKGIVANTGSLGMGISKAKGFIHAARLRGRRIRAVVVTGDGELQEGQIWESLASAVRHRMGELTVVVDHNKIQSDYSVERTSSLGDLGAKFRAFGWHVERIDGHDTRAIEATFAKLDKIADQPKVIIADTIKGKGVSFMEGTAIDSDVEMFQFHSGAPRADDYTRAAQELLNHINVRADALTGTQVEIETIVRPPGAAAGAPMQTLIPSYTEALLAAAERRSELVALDADLIRDMGLVSFAEKYPDRFLECGIAEHDMVSTAGAMALSGMLPVVHSFSCFLTTRANEQIYNNATEHTKVIYIGGLSGVLPAGPGHSHQSVREISAIGGIPSLVMVAPSCPAEVKPLFDWCIDTHDGPSFMRLVSIPVAIPYALPSNYAPVVGRGAALTAEADAVLIGSGPTLLTQAVNAAKALAADGIALQVVNLPWLNCIDGDWLATLLKGKRLLVTLDDHYVTGGQGEMVLAAAAAARSGTATLQLGLSAVPPSGESNEVLARVRLDSASIAEKIRTALA
jgi:transketolase